MNIFLKWHSSDEISLKTFLLKVFVGLQKRGQDVWQETLRVFPKKLHISWMRLLTLNIEIGKIAALWKFLSKKGTRTHHLVFFWISPLFQPLHPSFHFANPFSGKYLDKRPESWLGFPVPTGVKRDSFQNYTIKIPSWECGIYFSISMNSQKVGCVWCKMVGFNGLPSKFSRGKDLQQTKGWNICVAVQQHPHFFCVCFLCRFREILLPGSGWSGYEASNGHAQPL